MPIPWLTIILTLLTFFQQKRSGASNTRALLAAGLVGAGTYYVTHETDWGKANLGALDGVTPPGTGSTLTGPGGTTIIDPATGQPVKTTIPVPGSTTVSAGGTTPWDVLKSWGATGTAAVIGTTAVVTSSTLQKYLPWVIGGVAILLLTR